MYLMSEILINLVDVFLVLFFIDSMLVNKDLPMRYINATIFIFISTILTVFTIQKYNSNAVILVFLIYILYSLIFYSGRSLLKFLVPVVAFLIFNMVELITISLVTSFSSIDVQQLMGEEFIRLLLMIITRTIIFILMFLISLQMNGGSYTNNLDNNERYVYLYMIVPLASVLSMVFILRHYFEFNSDNLYLLVITISLFAVNIISFVQTRILITNLTRKYSIDLLLKENELKTELYDKTIKSYNHLKSWKHDIKFHLNTLGHLIANKSYTQLEEYINNIGLEMDNKIIVVNTGNVYLDSTISDFISKSKLLGVSLDIELEVPDISHIDNFDLCSLFGNFTSNALEAVQNIENKRVRISIALLPNKMIRIICENTFDGKIILNDSKILSRKGGTNHGYGLKNIRRIVKKYDGMIDVSYTESTFKVTILIPAVTHQDINIYIYNTEV